MRDWGGRPIAPEELRRRLLETHFARWLLPDRVQRLEISLPRLFESYLAARLRVLVSHPRHIQEFLCTARYVQDEEAHGLPEVWLHPEEFEDTLEGDCEDHALWAWVQYARLGWNARFTAGMFKGAHAWVVLFRNNAVRIHETTNKDPDYQPRDAHRCARYDPIWSVNGQLRFFWHGEAGEPPADVQIIERRTQTRRRSKKRSKG